MQNVDQIAAAGIAAVESAADFNTLELIKAQYMGKTGELNALLKQLGSLPPEEKKTVARTSTNAKTVFRRPITKNAMRLTPPNCKRSWPPRHSTLLCPAAVSKAAACIRLP